VTRRCCVGVHSDRPGSASTIRRGPRAACRATAGPWSAGARNGTENWICARSYFLIAPPAHFKRSGGAEPSLDVGAIEEKRVQELREASAINRLARGAIASARAHTGL
jgi:hypothetical protein